MTVAFTFDTNIIRKNSNLQNINAFIDEYEKNGDVFISSIVIDELSAYFNKIFHTEILNRDYIIKMIIPNARLGEHNCEKKTFEVIKKHLEEKFKGYILEHLTGSVDDIYQRALIKRAPFLSKTSDQGFKDTLLWMSILNSDLSSYKKLVFITDDRGFLDSNKELLQEFIDIHKIPIDITNNYIHKSVEKENDSQIQLPEEEMLSKTKSETTSTDDRRKLISDYQRLAEFRNDISSIIYDVCFSVDQDHFSFGNERIHFNIYSDLNIPSLEVLVEHFYKTINHRIFNNSISPYELFGPFIDHDDILSHYTVGTDIIIKFVDLIELFNMELSEYRDQFLDVIQQSIINYTKINRPKDSDVSNNDLPF